MNRDAVEQILLYQYTQGVTGGKALSKAIQSAIGDAPQRPFDEAHIELGLRDGLIRGQAVLNSKALRLAIDINADPRTVQSAIALRRVERIQQH